MPTLDETDPPAWPDPPSDSTPMMNRCHRLRSVAIDDLSPSELRLLIGQSIGLAALVPRALAVVEKAPLTEADYYPGDLLCALLALSADYWSDHGDEYLSLWKIAAAIEHLGDKVATFLAQPSPF